MINDRFVQVHGPFERLEEITNIIKEKYPDFISIIKLGIQAPVAHICYINNNLVEIGKTGILELENVKVSSLYFNQDEAEDTLIDCVLE